MKSTQKAHVNGVVDWKNLATGKITSSLLQLLLLYYLLTISVLD